MARANYETGFLLGNIPLNYITDFGDKIGGTRQYIYYMLARTQSMFKYTGLPDSMPQRNLELMLQSNGNVCITKVNDKLYAFTGGLGGEPNPYYMPTLYTVANPALQFTGALKIGEECVVIPNDSLYLGLIPMFSRYASMLAENDVTIRIADLNARIIALISADDDKTEKSAKQYLKDIELGKLGIVGGNAFLNGVKTQPYASSGSTNNITQLIELQQYLKAGWFNDIGLNANYNMKREAVNASEAQLNEDALLPLVDDMLTQRRRGIEAVNAMYGTNIAVDFASTWREKTTVSDGTEVNNGETD